MKLSKFLEKFKKKPYSQPIGLLDDNCKGICIFDELTKKYPHQSFIYLNYFDEQNDEAFDASSILKSNLEHFKANNCKVIICLSLFLMNNFKDILDNVNIPIQYLHLNLVEFVNNKYEHKNIAFFALEEVLKENIFNKSLKYNLLYNVSTDKMLDLIYNKKLKTEESFEVVNISCKNILNKQIDAIIYIESLIKLLKIELKEEVTYKEIIDLSSIAISKIRSKIDTINNSNNLIFCNLDKKVFFDRNYFIDNNYKYIKLYYSNEGELSGQD